MTVQRYFAIVASLPDIGLSLTTKPSLSKLVHSMDEFALGSLSWTAHTLTSQNSLRKKAVR